MLALLMALIALGALPGCASAPTASLPAQRSAVSYPPTVSGSPPVGGPIISPGGPYLYDKEGRVVIFHGVNAVYKLPPYELYPDPGKPWDLSASDASLMGRLGFNVVRLGMTWKGLEPGTAPANDPSICTPGSPHDPGQFDESMLEDYLAKLTKTVDLLGRFHIYTILDMHQDVYNELLDGEGFPNWAVCTSGEAISHPLKPWSLNYRTAAAAAAYQNFWANDVVGDLQGEYDRVWAAVASHFRNNPWVLGYDPFNEPFSQSLMTVGRQQFDAELECFYTGTKYVGAPSSGAPAFTCPIQDPSVGVIPTILQSDPNHLIFYEPDIFTAGGAPNYLGAMDFGNLVFNVHVYCRYRNKKTGNPTNLTACAAQQAISLGERLEDRSGLASPAQPAGPALFVSEFGATSNTDLLSQFTAAMNESSVGWTYWSWKYYDDPTGSTDEALVLSNGHLRSTVEELSQTYPEAIAGVPISFSFDPITGSFHLLYKPEHSIRAPTVIFVPSQIHYPHGYCARVIGGKVISNPTSELLEVRNASVGNSVRIDVSSGACRPM